MQFSRKKALGADWQDARITRITDHAPTGSLSWLYPFYEFQNGWYICNQISILNMCNHLEETYPRVPDDTTDPTVPISNSYIGLFQARSSKKMGAHHTGNWPAGPPRSCMYIYIYIYICISYSRTGITITTECLLWCHCLPQSRWSTPYSR